MGDEPDDAPEELLDWPPPRTVPRWVRRVGLAVVVAAAVTLLVRVNAGGPDRPRASASASVRPSGQARPGTPTPSGSTTWVPIPGSGGTLLRVDVVGGAAQPAAPVRVVDPAACPSHATCVSTHRVPPGWLAAVRDRFPGARVTSVRTVVVTSPASRRGVWSRRVRLRTARADVAVLLERVPGPPGNAVRLSATSAHVLGVAVRASGGRLVQIDVTGRSGPPRATYATLEALARDRRLLVGS